MRVRSDSQPDAVSITDYTPDESKVEVYVTENAKEVTITDEDGTSHTEWESDMYIFHVAKCDGLKEKIEAAISDWLATGRSLEVGTKATEMCERDDEIADLMDTLADAAQSEYDTLMSELEG